MKKSFIGVDGCPAGWFYVALQRNGGWRMGLVRRFADLWQAEQRSARLILVDIPIGLPVSAGGRACDRMARRLLGHGRRTSIFSPPCRQALAAPNYALACRFNQAVSGKKLSRQAWNITAKIREVDTLLRLDRRARTRIFETHPELCFWAFAGGVPAQHAKRTPAGFKERAALLESWLAPTNSIVQAALNQYPRREVGRDDVLDALAAAVTAANVQRQRLLPKPPETDAQGLPMAIVTLAGSG